MYVANKMYEYSTTTGFSFYVVSIYYDNLKDTNSYNLYQFSLTECVPRILPCTRKEIYFYVLYIF